MGPGNNSGYMGMDVKVDGRAEGHFQFSYEGGRVRTKWFAMSGIEGACEDSRIGASSNDGTDTYTFTIPLGCLIRPPRSAPQTVVFVNLRSDGHSNTSGRGLDYLVFANPNRVLDVSR